MEKFPTPEGNEKPAVPAESKKLTEREKALGEAKAFFAQRAREAANPDSGNTYVGGSKRFEAQMKAYISNIENGKFWDDVEFKEFKVEGEEEPTTDRSALVYLLDVIAKSNTWAELMAKDGKEDQAQQYRETAAKANRFLEAFITKGTAPNKKLLGMRQDRRFIADEEGNTTIEGSDEEKLAVINPDGSLDRFIDTEESAEPGRLESMVATLEQEGKEIDEEWKKLNADALEAGRKKWGFDAAEWSPELEQKMDALKRKSTWNFRLKNEVTNPSEENPEPRSLEEMENNLKQKIFESVQRLNQELEKKEISANSKIKIYYKWDTKEEYPRECFFSHIDPESGYLYASDAKIKKGGSRSLSGTNVEDVARVDKLPGGTFEKIKSKLTGKKSKSASQGK